MKGRTSSLALLFLPLPLFLVILSASVLQLQKSVVRLMPLLQACVNGKTICHAISSCCKDARAECKFDVQGGGLLAYLVGDQIHMSASLDSADRVDKAHLQQQYRCALWLTTVKSWPAESQKRAYP